MSNRSCRVYIGKTKQTQSIPCHLILNVHPFIKIVFFFNENQCLVCREIKLALKILLTNNFPHKDVLARFTTVPFNSSDYEVFIVCFFHQNNYLFK